MRTDVQAYRFFILNLKHVSIQSGGPAGKPAVAMSGTPLTLRPPRRYAPAGAQSLAVASS